MRPNLAKGRKPHIQATDAPCGFCGGKENQLYFNGTAYADGSPVELLFHVTCSRCRASGSAAKSAEEAIKAWGKVAPHLVKDEPPALVDDMNFDDEPEDEDGIL